MGPISARGSSLFNGKLEQFASRLRARNCLLTPVTQPKVMTAIGGFVKRPPCTDNHLMDE
uniref:Uncharacterized protein n=1 Tax=Anguilla anguilla TaxID=7936 RepID=A0A0E9T167_ANGAN